MPIRSPSPARLDVTGVSRRAFLGWLGAAGATAATAPSVHAAPSANAPPLTNEILRQGSDAGSCGPCSIGSALLHGDAAGRRAFHSVPGNTSGARLDALVAKYGTRPSETYHNRARFLPGAGITNDDLVFFANDFFHDTDLPAVRGDWLDQSAGETGAAQIRRIHGAFQAALDRGYPPVVEIRSFAADPSGNRENWLNLGAHWMAVLEVAPATLGEDELGFTCRCADSTTGRVITAFAQAEIFRSFNATRGFRLRPNGDKDWIWLTGGRPYLVLSLPSLPMYMQTRPWHARTLIALTYVIARDRAAA